MEFLDTLMKLSLIVVVAWFTGRLTGHLLANIFQWWDRWVK